MKENIDEIVAPLLINRKNLGVVVGIWQRDRSCIFCYSKTDTASSLPHDSKTLFEIGSLTKVFTTTLLASLVAEGQVNYDDPVCELLPELSKVPPEITLLRLATHTSGLPRLPNNLIWSQFKNPKNPYKAYQVAELYSYLARYKHNSKTFGKINYSNLGMGLLGHILAEKIGISYEQVIINCICNPLDLPDTRITLTKEQQARLAPGHLSNGKPTSNWDLPTLAGAGALRSTAKDLLKFIAANIDTSNTEIGKIFEATHELRVTGSRDSRFIGVGLGWFINQLVSTHDKYYWHNGATGGYRTYMSFVKEKKVGVVVLSNHGIGWRDLLFFHPSIDEIGYKVLEYLCQN